MRTLSLLALLAVLSACRDAVVPEPPPPSPTLRIVVAGSGAMEWPRNSGETVMFNSSLDQEAGLAGIAIAIGGVLETAALFLDAVHLKPTRTGRGDLPIFDVPEDGLISVRLWLTQHGEIVAHGMAEWALEPRVKWTIEIQRGPYPTTPIILEGADLNQPFVPCNDWRFCRGSYRIDDIREDAASYPGEALWLSVWGGYCPPDVVCY